MASKIDEKLNWILKSNGAVNTWYDQAAVNDWPKLIPEIKAALLADMLELVDDSPSYGINPDTGEITIYKTGHTSKAELRDKLKEYYQ